MAPANAAFENHLKKYTPDPAFRTVLRQSIIEAYSQQGGQVIGDRKKLTGQVQEIKEKLTHARDLLTGQKIDAEDYRDMKSNLTGPL